MTRRNIIFIPTLVVPAPLAINANFSVDLDSEANWFVLATTGTFGFADAYTYFAWFKAQDDGSEQRIFDIRGDDPDGNSLFLIVDWESGIAGNPLQWFVRDDTSTVFKDWSTASDLVVNDAWNSICLTTTGGTNGVFYVNGVDVTAGVTKTTDIAGSGRVDQTLSSASIGVQKGGNGRKWNGQLGHMAMWDSALTADEVSYIHNQGHPLDLRNDSSLYVSSADLIHYWPLASNNDAVSNWGDDFVDTLLDVTPVNFTAGDRTQDCASPELSVLLNGTDESFISGTNVTWGIADVFSFSFWALATDLTSNNRIIELREGGNNNRIVISIRADVANNPFRVQYRDSGGTETKNMDWDGVFDDNDWHHIVVTLDGGATGDPLLVYIDGVLTAQDSTTTDTTGTYTDSARTLTYGDSQASAREFEGNLGHLGIWDVILDQNDVDRLFTQKFAIDLRNDSGLYTKGADLQHFYRMGFGLGNIDEGNGTARDLTATGLTVADNIVVEAPAALVKLAADVIYYTSFDDEKIHRVDVDGSSNPDSWLSTDVNPSALRIDEATQRVYWANTTGTDRIEFSDYDGSNLTTITPAAGVINPTGLDIDGIQMFWTEYTADDVESADKIDGLNPVQLDGSNNSAREVLLDRERDLLYVCADDVTTGFFTYDRDGGNKDNFFTPGGGARPLGMDIDVDAQHIYWFDRIGLEIRRVNFDGTGDTLILDLTTVDASPGNSTGFAIDPVAEHIYWCDGSNDFIGRCDFDGGNASKFITLTPVTEGAPNAMDLHFPEGSYYATPHR